MKVTYHNKRNNHNLPAWIHLRYGPSDGCRGRPQWQKEPEQIDVDIGK